MCNPLLHFTYFLFKRCIIISVPETSEQFLEREKKKLFLIDQKLKDLNVPYDLLTEESDFINKKIVECAKKINDIANDINLVKNITNILEVLNKEAKTPETECNAEIPEIKIILDTLLAQQEGCNDAFNLLKILIQKASSQVKLLEKTVRMLNDNLVHKENYLIQSKNMISALNDKKKRLTKEIEQLKNEASTSKAVPCQHKRNIKIKRGFKKTTIEQKMELLNNTEASLLDTIEEHDTAEQLIRKTKISIESTMNLISKAKDNSISDLYADKKYMQSQNKRYELHMKICNEIQKKRFVSEKLKIAEEYSKIFQKKITDIKQAINDYKNKLFVQTFKLAIAKASISINLLKRDKLEAEIAFKVSEQ